MTVEVTPAGPDRVPELATLIGHAFSDDPIPLWVLSPNATEENVRLWALWYDELLAPLGMLWEAGEGLGAAAWIPPSEDERMIELDRAVRHKVAPLTDDGGARNARFAGWLWANLPEEPHWYLDHIAVDAERRGKGFGRALIDVGLAKAKADSVPAFLFTGRPERVPMFQHVGFRIEVDEDAPEGGPHIWFMRLDP